jgi:hypothetical protein
MSIYTVETRKWRHLWELTIFDPDGKEIGVTASTSLLRADKMVRDYLRLDGIYDAEIIIRGDTDQ